MRLTTATLWLVAEAPEGPGTAHSAPRCLIFCRTNHDCDQLERFLNTLGGAGGGAGGRGFRGKRESGKENPYSCCVLAGARR